MGDQRGTRVRTRLGAILIAAALTITGLVAAPPAIAADATENASDAVSEELTAALRTYIAAKPGVYSVSVIELDGEQRTVSISGTRRVEPASTIKLFYAWAALKAIDDGTLSLSSPLSSGISVARCLTLMIQLSDNNCSVDLRLKLGMRNLNRLFASAGYPNTYIVLDSRGRYVTKRTSTDDLALLLARLEQGTLLSDAMTVQFKNRLLAQVWRQRISSGVQAGTVIGSKSGQLWVSSGMVEADTAIVHGPTSTYVLTAVGTNNAITSAIRGISTIVYQHLQGPITLRATFPATQFVTTGKVALRTKPGGAVIKYLPVNTAVQMLHSNRVWLQVKVGSRTGWVMFQQLALHPAYLWPAPVEPGAAARTTPPCTPSATVTCGEG